MKKIFKLLSPRSSSPDALMLQNGVGLEHSWFNLGEEEGQLAVDIYQTDDAVVVKSTIAGARSKDIDISLVDDMLTIRGTRELDEDVASDSYLFRECYWGKFSRSIIMPIEVRGDKVAASLHNGVLTVILPKVKKSKHTTIRIKDNA